MGLPDSRLSEPMAITVEGAKPEFLSFSDLLASYWWVGSTLAFSYHIDTTRLQHALQELQRSWPALNGR